MKLKFILFISILVSLISINVSAKERVYIEDDLLQEYATEIGEMYDVSPFLIQAICERESSKNINAENGDCKGLMQISIKWHKDRMDELEVTDIFDAYSNILVGTNYLAELFEINEEPAYVLMRYNMKKNTANKLYKEGIISNYAKGILKRAEELEQEYQKKIEELLLLDKEMQKKARAESLPGVGIHAWL